MRWAQMVFVEDDPGNYDPRFWLDYFGFAGGGYMAQGLSTVLITTGFLSVGERARAHWRAQPEIAPLCGIHVVATSVVLHAPNARRR